MPISFMADVNMNSFYFIFPVLAAAIVSALADNETLCIKSNERYTRCLLGECVPKTCDDLGRPLPCPSIADPCADGCICVEGFVRNSEGDCIDKRECPGCNGDPNAESGCGNPCGKTCESYNVTGLTCTLECTLDGCDCIKGYVLNTETNRCVILEDCPKPEPTCGTNQTWVSCAVKCPDNYCPENDEPQPVCDAPNPCLPGCACKINYRDDGTGTCIYASECPPVRCTDPNAEWNSCPSACLAENCENADDPPVTCNTLLLNCQPKCVCKEGHYRDAEGLCIPKDKCPPSNDSANVDVASK